MDEMQDVLMNSIFEALSEKIDPDMLKRANTKDMRKKIFKSITNELFYGLFKKKKLTLSPGFGSVHVKDIKEKTKKIFDKKSQTMIEKHVSGRKIVYKPGDFVREFL